MDAPLDTEVAIETPEHIVFHYRLAGPARRAVAHGLDLVFLYGTLAVVFVIVFVLVMGMSLGGGELGGAAKAAGGLVLVALFAAQWVYFVVWEGTTGRSPGKMALGIRVVTTAGRPIGLRAAALRNLLRAADALPTAYVVGVASMALSSRFQRLGDLVAGTMVVVPGVARAPGPGDRARGAAAPLELSPPARPDELATLPDEVVLDADERAAIELFLRRRHTLGQARENELASMIAGSLTERLGFHHPDPSRLLALVYERAVNAGRDEAPPSSWRPKRKTGASRWP